MELQETAQQIAHLQGLLDEMREKYADREDLYEIYSQSIRDDVRTLTRRLRTAAAELDEEPDVWLGFVIRSPTTGQVPMSTTTKLLSGFRLCVKYAASISKGEVKPGGQFSRDVDQAAAFDIVSFETEGRQYGLKQSIDIDADASRSDLNELLQRDEEKRAFSRDAIRLLALGLHATHDDAALDDLVSTTSESAARLLIDRTEKLFPQSLDQLGIRLPGDSLSETFSSSQVRNGRDRRLDELSARPPSTENVIYEPGRRKVAVAEVREATEQNVEGVGRLVMLDIDNAYLRLSSVRLDRRDDVIPTLLGYMEKERAGVKTLLGDRVSFRGVIKAEDAKEVIRVDEITAAD
jgi:hypothetical protein